MILDKSEAIIKEVSKSIVGKNEVIRKVLMTIYSGGNVLLEDVPGVGKTTLALAFAKVLGLDYKRMQFTPDTMPSDITGFTMFNKETNKFEYVKGSVMCNLFLGDEINRTSAKTQSALLEAMEEKAVTVDGVTRDLPKPFICIATQNPLGSAGTQALPNSQLDRFMVKLSIGYPDVKEQIEIFKSHNSVLPLTRLQTVTSKEEIVEIQNYLSTITTTDDILEYIALLCENTRHNEYIELGVSPRGGLALAQMSKACAVLENRDYVVPKDVEESFYDVFAHRLVLRPKAKLENVTEYDVLKKIFDETPKPKLGIK